MGYKQCVIEYEQNGSGIIMLSENAESQVKKKCWNMLYTVDFDPSDDAQVELAFGGCMAWIEQNRAPGSKYIIMEMFFVE